MIKSTIQRYGLDYRLVESIEDLETLRVFRNMPYVRQEMFCQAEIDVQTHQKWFSLLDRSKNFNFIYGQDGTDIGTVNLKNVDTKAGIAESGICVGNPSFLKSPLNIAALLFLYEYAFCDLSLQCLQAHIRPTNKKAINMNLSLGFKLEDATANRYRLTKNDYLNTQRRFARLFLSAK
jgi:RimJ/RimL family protein N-acetyltransferase